MELGHDRRPEQQLGSVLSRCVRLAAVAECTGASTTAAAAAALDDCNADLATTSLASDAAGALASADPSVTGSVGSTVATRVGSSRNQCRSD